MTTRTAPPEPASVSVDRSGYAAITEMMQRFDLAASSASRLMRSLGASPRLLEQIRQTLLEHGDAPNEMLAELLSHLPDTANQDLVIRNLADMINFWDRDRITIPFDPDVWDELGAIADNDLVSPDVFSFLPYPNPFIVFPRPFIWPTRDPLQQHRVTGAYIFGIRPAEDLGPLRNAPMRLLCRTDDPRADSIAFRFAGFITDLDGNPAFDRPSYDPSVLMPDTVFTLCMLHFIKPVERFGALAARTTHGFTNFETARNRILNDRQTAAADAVAALRHALAAVMYLCCSNRDLTVRQPAKRTGKGGKAGKASKGNAASKPVIVGAGYQLGAKIRTWRIEQARQGSGASTGARRRPHPRRSHFHRFRYGPGRAKLSQPRFMPMVWVNAADREDLVLIKPVAGD